MHFELVLFWANAKRVSFFPLAWIARYSFPPPSSPATPFFHLFSFLYSCFPSSLWPLPPPPRPSLSPLFLRFSLSLSLSFFLSLIVNATASIKSLDRHLCTPGQLPLYIQLSSSLFLSLSLSCFHISLVRVLFFATPFVASRLYNFPCRTSPRNCISHKGERCTRRGEDHTLGGHVLFSKYVFTLAVAEIKWGLSVCNERKAKRA